MADSLVVDASVAIKWLVQEDKFELARALIFDAPARPLLAPDLIVAELGNILWKRQGRGFLHSDEAAELAGLIVDPLAFPVELMPSRQLLASALRIAAECDRSVYDSLYVALAVAAGTTMVTADARLVHALTSTRYAANVRLL